jgi:hypothetical protein
LDAVQNDLRRSAEPCMLQRSFTLNNMRSAAVAKPHSRTQSKRQSKRATPAKALKSARPAEDILKQNVAYGRPKPSRVQGKSAHDAPPAARKLQHPLEVAAQHWMQALMLPWAGWTALGAMAMNWPLMHMRLGAEQRPDEKRREAGRS